MKIAILFNSNSHLDNDRLIGIGKILERFLHGQETFAHAHYGAGFVPFANVIVPEESEDHSARGGGYKDRLRSAVLDLLALTPIPDVFITVGGDGLAAYVAQVLIRETSPQIRPTILGVAAGTANVGPIVSFTAERLIDLNLSDLVRMPVDAVEILDGTDHVGYAFNDVILGNTLLATVDGTVHNVSVEKLVMEDRWVITRPGTRIAGKNFKVTCEGKEVPYASFCDPEDIKQVVATTLQFDRLYGRAIFGGLCLGDATAGKAAIGLCDRIVVDSNQENWDWKGFTGTRHLVFEPEEVVVLTGLGPDAQIVVDGNPYLRKHESVTFKSVPQSVSIFRT